MTHVLAVLGLVAACLLWYALQRWSGSEGALFGLEVDRDCDGCEFGEPGCRPPSPPADSRPTDATKSASR